MRTTSWRWAGALLTLFMAAGASTANAAGDSPPTVADLKIAIDTVWVLSAGMLVFFMSAGFGMLEAGFNRSKNCANILSKNFVVFAVTSIFFWLFGFGVMFSRGNPLFGTEGIWALIGPDNSPATGVDYEGVFDSLSWTSVPLYAKLFFHLAFAATAATVVSGAVAERIKYHAFILFSIAMVVVVYPVTGHWIWGGGWLQRLGMLDFAGSTVVHSVGGWAALTGIFVLGPRLGRYNADGSINPIPGHNMLAATLGVFILWLGWFGFNPGSTMEANPDDIALVCITTNISAAAGVLAATITSWLWLGKPDLGMSLNGCLAGLVAITASCRYVSIPAACMIGLVAGVLVVLGVIYLDRMKLDDPVGVVPVHLLNGLWGTLALGLFHQTKGVFNGGGTGLLGCQAVGMLAVAVYVVVVTFGIWHLVKVAVGLRASPEEEMLGLDIGEHGNMAYPDFVTRRFSPSLPRTPGQRT